MSVKLPKATCPYEDCQNKWHPRVENPVRCPKCGRRLDKGRERLLKRGLVPTHVSTSEILMAVNELSDSVNEQSQDETLNEIAIDQEERDKELSNVGT